MKDLTKYIGVTNFEATLNLNGAPTIKHGILDIVKNTVTDVKIKTNKKGKQYAIVYVNGEKINCCPQEYDLKEVEEYLKWHYEEKRGKDFRRFFCNEGGFKVEEAIIWGVWNDKMTEENIRKRLEQIALDGYKKELEAIRKEREEALKDLEKREAKVLEKLNF